MDERTLRERAALWRRRAAAAIESRQREANARIAEQYEAMAANLAKSPMTPRAED